MSHEYRNQVDITNNNIINDLLNGMPEFLEDFYNHLLARGLSTSTIKSYFYEINVYLRFLTTIAGKESITSLIVTDLDLVRVSQLENYIARSEDGTRLTANAMRRKLSVVKSLYNYYFNIGQIKKNPALQLRGAALKQKDVIKLSNSQVKALLDCIQNQAGVSEHSKAYSEKLVYRDLAIIMVLLGTGMRISELVGLNISDFDMTDADKPCFHIIRKGGDDDTVFFVEQVKESVLDYLELTRPLLSNSNSETALFLSTQHKRMGVNSIEKMMKKYCQAAGLPDNISPHKLRATFATTVYKQTKDIYAVKDSLHHKSIDTSKHYISDKDERKQSAATAAGTLFD